MVLQLLAFNSLVTCRDRDAFCFDNMTVKVIPARLSYLTLYSPLLSKSDDTRRDQIVFYYDRERDEQQSKDKSVSDNVAVRNEEQYQNEELRRVGLAQGMVEFAKYARGRFNSACRLRHGQKFRRWRDHRHDRYGEALRSAY